jgi:uncharacterized membrane protein
MSNFLESKKVRTLLWVLVGLIVLCVVFGLGLAVGYGRAGFGMGFDRNYYRNFYGGFPGDMTSPGPQAMHGSVGTVIDIATSTITVKDQKENEESIELSSGTVIRENNDDIMFGDIKIGDQIAVIGDPNQSGQVIARFIRIFPASSSIPMASPGGQ